MIPWNQKTLQLTLSGPTLTFILQAWKHCWRLSMKKHLTWRLFTSMTPKLVLYTHLELQLPTRQETSMTENFRVEWPSILWSKFARFTKRQRLTQDFTASWCLSIFSTFRSRRMSIGSYLSRTKPTWSTNLWRSKTSTTFTSISLWIEMSHLKCSALSKSYFQSTIMSKADEKTGI